MLWAIFSDVHGHSKALKRVIKDAQRRGARAFVNLGDLGNGTSHELLSQIPARSVLGNWEVSSWHLLPPPWRDVVRRWPFQLREKDVLFCHASPVWPEEVKTVDDALTYVREHGSWFALFPPLAEKSDALWEAFAHMGSQNIRIAFHGHTHIQKVWILTADNHLRAWKNPLIPLRQDGSLYIIGVGSVGRPLDGPGTCYALWDDQANEVKLIRL